ncbi:ribonuclease HII [Tardibacter chloracetimidivorans]|uniref:Ribonuclease HII n=1 Tax=Tardibacter chloracetimidivorans TaxID=1921510 RepID=A0A1L3ZR00_9SPHN|nr:ribonuclease HII [Tardibacter chloracetimidivorans]API58052.1 ribonuclease HII [Tardibacter chloracetimidivorans]
MTGPTLELELGYGGPVVGVDEAGRGPLAGPVVAAAVLLDPDCIPDGINDSKKLSEIARARLHDELVGCARVGVGIASVEEIDSINILQASLLAMRRAVDALDHAPVMVLVDGNQKPKWPYPCRPVIGGDALSLSIAAASIIAKVTRDRMMIGHDEAHPGYGWRTNKGYGTPEHLDALRRLGPTPLHRRSFAPVAQYHLL